MNNPNKEANRRYWAKMDRDKRQEMWRAKYHKHKDRYLSRSRAWALANPHKAQASTHQTQIRQNYPEAFSQCNFTTSELSEWIKEGRTKTCPYCGDLCREVDHVIALSLGGEHKWSNLRMLCKFCNRAKSNLTLEEFENKLDSIVNYRLKSLV